MIKTWIKTEIKIGNDIIETKRIKRLYSKFGKRFVEKIFTTKEIEYCESKGEGRIYSYAARFAGKAAIFKAISELLDNKYDIGWKDIEILNDESGKPHADVKGINYSIDISLSHEKDYAIATALVVIND